MKKIILLIAVIALVISCIPPSTSFPWVTVQYTVTGTAPSGVDLVYWNGELSVQRGASVPFSYSYRSIPTELASISAQISASVGLVPNVSNAATSMILPDEIAKRLPVNTVLTVWENGQKASIDNGTGTGYMVSANVEIPLPDGKPSGNSTIVFTPGVQEAAGWTAGWRIMSPSDASDWITLSIYVDGVQQSGYGNVYDTSVPPQQVKIASASGSGIPPVPFDIYIPYP